MEQILVFLTLGIALVLFVWEKLRYDIVALLALFVLIIAGIIPAEDAFTGFSHPAVITVAAVLVISQALQHSGLIDVIGRILAKLGTNLMLQIVALSFIVAVASAFMNNIGALAILMPVALHMARKHGNPPSYILMPIAFASILGGMVTLIGTPPNIIIATFRANVAGERFGMFDFAPVGLSLALVGLLFITLLGWRLLPKRKTQTSSNNLFHIENYITEVKVPEDSKLNGRTIAEMNRVADTEVLALGLVRKGIRIHAPSPSEEIKPDDILILEADTDDLRVFIDNTGTELTGGKQIRKEAKGSEDIHTVEAIVMADSPLIGQTAASLNMRTRYRINLLAVARREKQIWQRIGKIHFKTGDVLLLQGRTVNINDAITTMQCLPLAERGLTIGKPRKMLYALSIFVAAIAAVVLGVLPVQIAFTFAAVAMVLSGILPLRDMYTSIDWPVIVLLAAMIPVGVAFETSGSADMVTNQILSLGDRHPIWLLLGIIMTITILLSNVINNAATVVLMAPIGINIASELGVSADPFLMAIAIAASCAFLTPIGHQSNTLVMGPGGYKFSDYWKMGLPITIGMVLLGVPLIMYFWPP
ncbi:SLC13 family permease [Pontibacter diazotrophicus]|uniref:SLC13 family permease n=1 Tax=Pontibacter diazotrophicus TaxID=1400979 RepID=A0A3D8LHM6_9BACT|nr:SLC13 family permease [Pontibacter diazotrophicus]RDV16949.1 SLC13 family permease [Pontibacter diazotrophicus]